MNLKTISNNEIFVEKKGSNFEKKIDIGGLECVTLMIFWSLEYHVLRCLAHFLPRKQ